MAELPHTRDLPTSPEGYERARVEEAFSEFAERVRELEAVAAELRTELRTLRAERVAAPRRAERETWPGTGVAPSPDWIAAVPAPLPRVPTVPRIVLEAGFLLLVGLLAGLADLSATRIVLVMGAAWALVALTEWAAAAKRARWHLDEVAPAVEQAGAAASESTGPWAAPIVEATVVDESESESKTVVTKLPADESAPEETAERPLPAPRRGLRRRRRPAAEAGAADPGEA
jgi:hypothetical protein